MPTVAARIMSQIQLLTEARLDIVSRTSVGRQSMFSLYVDDDLLRELRLLPWEREGNRIFYRSYDDNGNDIEVTLEQEITGQAFATDDQRRDAMMTGNYYRSNLQRIMGIQLGRGSVPAEPTRLATAVDRTKLPVRGTTQPDFEVTIDPEEYDRAIRHKWYERRDSGSIVTSYARHDMYLTNFIMGSSESGLIRQREPGRDYRKSNLYDASEDARRRRERAAHQFLQDVVRLQRVPPTRTETIRSGQWRILVDPFWYEDLSQYRWLVAVDTSGIIGRVRVIRRVSQSIDRRRPEIYMGRVVARLQDPETAATLAPGQVVLFKRPDQYRKIVDMTEYNIIVDRTGATSRRIGYRGGSSEYTGVHLDPRRGAWTASITMGKDNFTLGRYGTERRAAQARDAEIIRLGLDHIIPLNFPQE